jgi:cytoskeletal protein CcmA (bactofilin family)
MWKSDKQEVKRTMAEEAEAEDNSLSSNLGSQEAAQDVSAFVGKGVEFKGTISYSGTVRIDGSLDGEIHTEGVLLVGEEAVITAKVTAGTIVCKGKITGDVVAKN